MRDNLPEMLRAAAKEWREENKFVGIGETRYDVALEEAANAIEELQKRVPKTPHGRLIDADALIIDKSQDLIHKGMVFGGQYVFSESAILNAPTIIEAEGGE